MFYNFSRVTKKRTEALVFTFGITSFGLCILVLVVLPTFACSSERNKDFSIEYVSKSVYEDITPVVQLTATPTPLPDPEFFISKSAITQGGTLLLSVAGSIIQGSVTFLGFDIQLTRGDRSYYTFIPISRVAEVGMHKISISVTYSDDSEFKKEMFVEIIPREWTFYDFTGDSFENPTLLSSAQREDEDLILKETFSFSNPVKLWRDGPWLKPLHFNARITSEFGEERDYGDNLIRYHEGVDFSADEGTPVYASNRGVVVLATQLSLRGNYIAIDHGGGLYSAYGHLSAFAAGEGQMVEAGDLIGYVGSSGLSTGAHLHWEIIVHGTPVDALRFTNGLNGF